MVNPSNPTDIYLVVNHNKIVEIISFIISIIVLLLGIFSAYLGLSRAKNNKKELKNCIFILFFVPWIIAFGVFLVIDIAKSNYIWLVLHSIIFISIFIVYQQIMKKNFTKNKNQNG